MIELLAILFISLGLTFCPCRNGWPDDKDKDKDKDKGGDRRSESTVAGSPTHSKDMLQKFLMDKFRGPMLQILGISSDIAESAVELNTEILRPQMELRRPDIMLQMADGSIHIFEFQSTANDYEILRYLDYTSLAVLKFSTKEKIVPVSITVIYFGGIEKPPRKTLNDANHQGDGYLQLTVNQIFLDKLIDMAKLVKELKDDITKWEKDGGDFPLPPPLKLTELFLAPLGHIKGEPWELTGEYLNLGRILSEKTGDMVIFGTMIYSVMTRGNIVTDDTLDYDMEVFRKMGIKPDDNIVKLADIMLGGKFSFLQESNKTMEESYKTMEESYKTLEEKAKSLEESNKSLVEATESFGTEIASLNAELDDLKTSAIVSMHNDKKSVHEISRTLKLKLSEVARVLRNEGKSI
ncbi:MAG: hypothetical protein LBR80_01420 [Deltaproteobacteria bacterium]|jgi:hypothetical protein|nr:hypothetical protein [Deltaproteobacteria bacterium]